MTRVWPWLSHILSIAFIGFAVKSLVSYHKFSLEEQLEDVKGSPLPVNEAGLKWFKDMLFARAYGEGQQRTRTHTIITSFLAVALFLQLWKKSRSFGGKGKPLHVWLGRATILCALLGIPHFWELVSNFPHRPTMYAEYLILLMIPFYGLKGWWEIRVKDWQSHRASMIMFSACFYYFGVQRLCMLILGVLHHEKSPLASHLGLGKWQNWNTEDYNAMFGIAVWSAFVLTFGVATYNAYIGPESKAARDAKAVENAKAK